MRKIIMSVVLLAAFLIVLAPATYAAGSTNVVVTISGAVTNSTFGQVSLRAHASGTMSSLSGAGTDSPPPNTSRGNPAVCQFPLSGKFVTSNVVTLTGLVTQSSLSSEIGTSIMLTVNASNGAITWNFGGFPFTGFGTVDVRTP